MSDLIEAWWTGGNAPRSADEVCAYIRPHRGMRELQGVQVRPHESTALDFDVRALDDDIAKVLSVAIKVFRRCQHRLWRMRTRGLEAVIRRHHECMGWEWIAPLITGVSGATGVFFTWLAGAQGRSHTERMVAQSQQAEQYARLRNERRDAYFAVMRAAYLELQRLEYEQTNQTARLHELEQYWTTERRIEMSVDALIGLFAFGSDEAREFIYEWREAADGDDLTRMNDLAERFRDLVKSELKI
ncbi:hypothetical protein [Streptomyces sp. NPDC047525]|uniref:hypothetical protein n=1 Tax=Streptomyces sp. NPDC047525 TaxID=3155264 RepID=UPI0033DA5D59